MLVSCSFCGLVHKRGETCKKRIKAKRRPKEADFINKFRWGSAWKKKREEIKKLDKFLCQICLLNKYHTERIYNFDNLEVHHILNLKDYFSLKLENSNLITLCSFHHKMAEEGIISIEELEEITKKRIYVF